MKPTQNPPSPLVPVVLNPDLHRSFKNGRFAPLKSCAEKQKMHLGIRLRIQLRIQNEVNVPVLMLKNAPKTLHFARLTPTYSIKL